MQYIIHHIFSNDKRKRRGGDVLVLYISPPFYQGLVVTVVLSLLSLLPLYPMVLFGAVIVMLPPR
jgi:hypothetical protein